MASFREVFTNEHVVLPVVHVETLEQTLKNAQVARDAGCDGVFLISMRGMGHYELWRIHSFIAKQIPNWWIGINYLGVRARHVFYYVDDQVSGVWVDNANIDERMEVQDEAKRILRARNANSWSGLYFGGVDFKYQRPAQYKAQAAKIAAEYMDVVTTSGLGTGLAADVEKIKTMKEAIGTHPLAIASGISPENVGSYLEYADCFLVATSLLIPHTGDFDPHRVSALMSSVRR